MPEGFRQRVLKESRKAEALVPENCRHVSPHCRRGKRNYVKEGPAYFDHIFNFENLVCIQSDLASPKFENSGRIQLKRLSGMKCTPMRVVADISFLN